MFVLCGVEGCSSLTAIDLSGFDILEGCGFQYMFYRCSKLADIKLFNCNFKSKTLNAVSMFYGCSSLKTIDMSKFTAKIYSLSEMFKDCTELISVDISGLDTSEISSAGEAFSCCSKLSVIYVGNKWDISHLEGDANHFGMFSDCISLPNFDFAFTDKTNAHTGEGGYLTLKV